MAWEDWKKETLYTTILTVAYVFPFAYGGWGWIGHGRVFWKIGWRKRSVLFTEDGGGWQGIGMELGWG